MGKSGNQSSSDYWSLSGVFSFRGGHGAVIVNNTTGQIQQIETGKKNESGLSLIRVEGLNTDDPLKVKVANREGDTFWVLNKRER